MITATSIGQRKRATTEEQLVNNAKRDQKSFEPLYRKYHEQMFRFIWQRIADKETAHDLTSQVFMKALKAIPQFEYRGVPFSSWLYQICRNELNVYYRTEKIGRALRIDDNHLAELKCECDWADFENHEDEDQNELLIALIDALDDDALFIIEMRFFEKRSILKTLV